MKARLDKRGGRGYKDSMPAESRPRVLIVDDDEDFRLVVELMLATQYDVVSLDNGEGLLEELATSRPDLVILDVMLPGRDGFQLCRDVRSKPTLANLPILFLTSSRKDNDFVDNLEAGGNAYLTKPVSQKALLKKLSELLSV
jgi:DNA-binding response OmpR family regulator